MNLKGRGMRVKGSFTTTTEVNVSPDDALWALRVEVLRIKGIDVNAYIDDKKRLVKMKISGHRIRGQRLWS
jgi:hypothetical protein